MTKLVKPMVSVCMITYNHEKFIAQAIESVLMQQSDFVVELVIGEDCSTDDTRAVVRAYGDHYPEQIRLLLPEQNKGAMANFIACLAACSGKYIALCEGDDYWTDPLKLQKQVDFLEKNPDYSMCCHASHIIFEGSKDRSEIQRLAEADKTLTLDDFLAPTSKNSIRTESVVCKSEVVHNLPEWYQHIIVGDYPLFMLLAYHGNIRYIDQVMSVHRKHEGGVWTSQSGEAEFQEEYCLSIVEMYRRFDEYSGYQYHDKIQKRFAYSYYALIAKASDRNMAEGRKYLWKYWYKLSPRMFIEMFSRLHIKPPLQWIRDHTSVRR